MTALNPRSVLRKRADVQQTYRSVSAGQVKTKQQGMSCGMTAAQKPCAPANKAGLPAASASSLITLQLNQQHRLIRALKNNRGAQVAAGTSGQERERRREEKKKRQESTASTQKL